MNEGWQCPICKCVMSPTQCQCVNNSQHELKPSLPLFSDIAEAVEEEKRTKKQWHKSLSEVKQT